MYTGLLHSHSALRWLVLIFMVAAGVKSLVGWMQKSDYGKIDDKLSLYTLIATHTQLLLGLGLLAVGARVNFGNLGDAVTRYFTVEHGFMMLIVVALITVGRVKSKKKEIGFERHKTVALFYLISLAIVLGTLYIMMPL